MSCERFEALLQEQLDGALSKSEALELEQHLADCTRCRLDALIYRKMAGALDSMPTMEAPTAAISEGVRASIEREPRRASSVVIPLPGRHRFAWGALALAAVVFMALGLQLGTGPAVENPPVVAVATDDLRVPDEEPVVAPRPAPLGRLVADGTVTVLRSGQSVWQEQSGEIELALGDRFQVNPQAEGILYYMDRGRLTIKPGTDLQIISDGVRIRRGSAWIKISKRGTGFFAETPNAVAAVRGTIYTVEVKDTMPTEAPQTVVNVFRGEVGVFPGTVENPLSAPVILTKDECVAVEGASLGSEERIQLAAYKKFGMAPPPDVIEPVDVAVEPPVDTTVDVDVVTATETDDPDATATVSGHVELLGNEDQGSTGVASSAAARPGR